MDGEKLVEVMAKAIHARRIGGNPDWPIGVNKLGHALEPYVDFIPSWKWNFGGDARAALAAIEAEGNEIVETVYLAKAADYMEALADATAAPGAAPKEAGAPGVELVVTTQMMEAGIWKLREWLGSWGRTDEQTSDLQAKIGIRSVLSAMLGDRVRFPDLSQKSDEIIPQSDGIGGSRERGD